MFLLELISKVYKGEDNSKPITFEIKKVILLKKQDMILFKLKVLLMDYIWNKRKYNKMF